MADTLTYYKSLSKDKTRVYYVPVQYTIDTLQGYEVTRVKGNRATAEKYGLDNIILLPEDVPHDEWDDQVLVDVKTGEFVAEI